MHGRLGDARPAVQGRRVRVGGGDNQPGLGVVVANHRGPVSHSCIFHLVDLELNSQFRKSKYDIWLFSHLIGMIPK